MVTVIINGAPTAGKDTFVEMCRNTGKAEVLNISTVDFVKEVAFFCGWDGYKDPASRELLANLKQILAKWDDVPVKKIKEFIKENEDPNKQQICFVHSREPEEIERLCNELNAYSLIVRRAAVESEKQSNSSDANVFNYEYDFTIDNNSTKEDLQTWANAFMNVMFE